LKLREPTELRDALASVLGITVVSKIRRLFIHERVRIHLDRVEGAWATSSSSRA
jgi:adenylate cyclase class IV